MTETSMVIAVDIKGSETYQNFILETCKRLTQRHLQHTFLFIFDKPFDHSLVFSKNVIPLIVSEANAFLLSQLRINYKISSVLKKYKADIFLTSKTLARTKVSQCLITGDITSPKSLEQATLIITDSEFSKKEVIEKNKINPDKVCFVYKGVDKIYKPLLFEEKEIIKEQYSEGNEYFLASGMFRSENNILNLLKAFSVFKKMQKSNMQLLIHIQTNVSKEIVEALRLFKFKSDVKILRNIDKIELAKITGAAYAFISPIAQDGYSQILAAMKCDVPVIASNVGAMPEVALDAALYVDISDHKNVSDKMMLIYKDEKLRQQLIEKGKERVNKFSWSNTAAFFWKGIEKACW